MDKDSAESLIHAIGNAILDEPALADVPWDGVAVTANIDVIVLVAAYRFVDGEVHDVELENDLSDLIVQLRDATTDDTTRPFVACLIQITAETFDIEIEFEHDDPTRWKLTPDNFETLPATLNPQTNSQT